MNMKKLMTMSVLLLSAMPLTLLAQDDDMYFVPTKENVAKEARTYGMPKDTYYSGSSRSIDDYNRQAWSTVAPIDSMGNDIINFSAVRGVYPDSSYSAMADNDYQLTRRMSRFDDYTPTEAYWDGYRDGSWASPWYYSSHFYPWYDSWYWNAPWYYGYYGYYGGWYSPWHYGYYRPWGYYGYYGYGHRWHGGSYYRPGATHRFHVSRPAATGSRTYSSNGGIRHGNPSTSRFGNGTFGNSSSMSRGSSGGGGTRSSGSFGGGSRSGGGGGGFSRGR